jgi:hypothetical protein
MGLPNKRTIRVIRGRPDCLNCLPFLELLILLVVNLEGHFPDAQNTTGLSTMST